MKIGWLFTDRSGGVSLPPYDSLNLALHTGDDPSAVLQNRNILQNSIGLPLYFMRQVHGDNIAVVDKSTPQTLPDCDAMITKRRGIALVVMVADCIPLLLFDEKKGVVAAVHAGRNGTFLNIGAKCVKTMVERFGCRSGDIYAEMGPSIRACCYEISEEMARLVRKSFGESYMNGRYLDLQSLNRDRLLEAGLREDRIDISDICTCCSTDHFSYRREGTTGRFAGAIWIENR